MRASHMPKAFWAEHLEQIERREMSIAAYALVAVCTHRSLQPLHCGVDGLTKRKRKRHGKDVC